SLGPQFMRAVSRLSRTPQDYMARQPRLIEDLGIAWMTAAIFCLIAAVPLGIYGAISIIQTALGKPPEIHVVQWFLFVFTIFASYFTAATLAGPLYWITRPLRPGWFGNAVTGSLITPIVYGSVAAVAYFAWDPAGQTIFGDHGMTREQFGADLPEMLLIFAV